MVVGASLAYTPFHAILALPNDFSLGGEGPTATPSHTTQALIGLTCLFLGTSLAILEILFTPHLKAKAAPKILAAATMLPILLLSLTGLINYASWTNSPEITLNWESRPKNPNALAAGKAYVETLHTPNLTPKEIEDRITPLLTEPQWQFAKDDPTLYYRNGILNNKDTTIPNWLSTLPAMEAHKQAQALLDAAKTDALAGNLSEANKKTAVVLGIANRIPPDTLFETLLSQSLTHLATDFLLKNPEIAKSNPTATELARLNLEGNIKIALLEEYKISQKFLRDTLVIQNGKPLVGAFLINQNFLSDLYQKAGKTNTDADLAALIQNHKMKLLTHGQLIQYILCGIPLPRSQSTLLQAKKIQKEIQKLKAS
jgi:hypothetical protein